MPLTDEERRAMRERLRKHLGLGPDCPTYAVQLNEESAIRWAASEVERELASIAEWIRGAEARMKKQGEAGAVSLHYMHVAGQLDACAAIANAIEKGEHR